MTTPLKRCPRCERFLPATTDYFNRKRDQLYYMCKDCRREDRKKHRARDRVAERKRYWRNVEKEREELRRRYWANPERARAKRSAYYYANREEVNGRRREHRRMNLEEYRQRDRERYARTRKNNPEYRAKRLARYNPEKARERNRAYYRKNRDRLIAYQSEWARRNPDKVRGLHHRRRARERAAPGTFSSADVQAQYDRQKGRCYWCNCPLNGAYHVDHVVPLSRGGSNYPSNLVIACVSCNSQKHNKLPHEWDGSGGRLL